MLNKILSECKLNALKKVPLTSIAILAQDKAVFYLPVFLINFWALKSVIFSGIIYIIIQTFCFWYFSCNGPSHDSVPCQELYPLRSLHSGSLVELGTSPNQGLGLLWERLGTRVPGLVRSLPKAGGLTLARTRACLLLGALLPTPARYPGG